jgi:iron complex transport system substrate-binding protein
MIAGGSPLYEVDVPLLEKLKPELIVTQAQCDVCAVRYADVVDAVERSPVLAKSHVVALNPTRLEEVFRDILHVGEMAHAFEQARAYVTALRVRVEAIRHRVNSIPLSARPRVICLEWTDPPMVAANWTPELVQIAGGKYELAQTGVHSAYADWNEVLLYAPEVIVVAPCGFDLRRSEQEIGVLARLPRWESVPAVRTGRVYLCDGNAYFNRSGPRLLDTLELLAHFIHPAKFAAPNLGEGVWRAW